GAEIPLSGWFGPPNCRSVGGRVGCSRGSSMRRAESGGSRSRVAIVMVLLGAIVVPASATRARAANVNRAPKRAPSVLPGLRGRIPNVDPDQILVRLRSHPSDLGARFLRAGARFRRGIPHTSWEELSITRGTAARVRARLRHDSAVAQTQLSYR